MLFVFILVLGGILFNTCVVAFEEDSVLDANSLGVSCFPVLSESKASIQGGIKIFLEDLEVEDGVVPSDLKVPVLLFRYEDILNFTTLPSWEEYREAYASNYSSKNLDLESYFLKNSVDFEQNKFILDLYEGYNEIDEKRIYNGFLDASKENGNNEALLPVYESGMYCVYIAPPIDKNIKIMRVPVEIQYSRLYSSNMMYANYSKTKYIIGFGLLLAAYLIHDVLKFSTDKRLNIKNMPIISKVVIFYVLMPLLAFASLEWFVVFIELHSNLSNHKKSCFKYFRLAMEWIQPNWKILFRFYALLFTMGYGVIYYHRGASRTFRKMPKRTKNVAWTLFITDLTLNNTEHVYYSIEKYLMTCNTLALYKDTMESICTICFFGSFVFPFVLYFVSFIYYFKTRNIIKKLPPTSTVSEGIDVNTRIMKAFKQSGFLILISPSISGLAWVIAYGRVAIEAYYSMMYDMMLDSEPTSKVPSRESLMLLVRWLNYMLLFTEDTTMSLIQSWPLAIKIYLTITLLYVIWIRNNNVLVVEDEKGDFNE
ncbi:unnamed protein product [Debaryomyces tyrocola]|nr:unnamed protein product [Debaryomyces tyrocola]